MRVLFIYPNLNAQIGFNYGIAAISGLLKAAGHRDVPPQHKRRARLSPRSRPHQEGRPARSRPDLDRFLRRHEPVQVRPGDRASPARLTTTGP